MARRTTPRLHVTLASRIFAPEAAAAAFRLKALTRALVRAGAAVTVLTTREPRGTRAEDVDGARVRRAPVLRDADGQVRGYLQYLSFDIPLAVRLLFGRTPDVYVCEPPPTTGAVVRVMAALKRRPYVYYAADIWSDAAQSIDAPTIVLAALTWVERFALRGAARVIAVSDAIAKRLADLGIDSAVVRNGIDTETFSIDGGTAPEAPLGPYFLYAGTASEWQGADIFVRAMDQVLQAHPNARLIFLGQGAAWDDIAAAAAPLPPGTVTMLPTVAPEQAASWLRGAAAALVSIRPGIGYDFAYPTKTYAAWATGTPVVYAGPGPVRDDLADSPLGEGVDYDVDQVAQAMGRALTQPDNTDHRAARARWVEQHASAWRSGDNAAAVVAAPVVSHTAR